MPGADLRTNCPEVLCKKIKKNHNPGMAFLKEKTLLRKGSQLKIDGSLDKEEKRRDFIRQIENPCLYRQGEYIVSLKFADTDVTLEERLLEYLERSEGEEAPWELLH